MRAIIPLFVALALVNVADGFFEQMFGGGDVQIDFGGGGMFGGGGRRRTQDVNVKIDVSLEDFYNGRTLPLSLQRKSVCTGCQGSGAKTLKTCTKCNGRGVVRHPIHPIQQHCPTCGGKGKIPESKCPICKGQKMKKETVKHEVNIHRGAKPDLTVTLRGQADEAPGAEAGDVHVHFSATPHTTFSRDGGRLLTTIPIGLGEALVGFNRKLSHMDGHSVDIAITSPTQHMTVRSIMNEGMPLNPKASRFGALDVTYLVKYPAALTGAQVDAVKQLWPQEYLAVEEALEELEGDTPEGDDDEQ